MSVLKKVKKLIRDPEQFVRDAYLKNNIKKKTNEKFDFVGNKWRDEKDNSPMEFSLFKEDNKAENFSDDFHKKFNELEDQVIYNQQLKGGQ